MFKPVLVAMIVLAAAPLARADDAAPPAEQVLDLEAPGMVPATPPPPPIVLAPLPRPAEPIDHKSTCLFGRPQPHCGSVFVIEAGYRAGTDVTSTFDIGILANVTRDDAVGATIGGLVMTSRDETEHAIGSGVVKLRYRRWLAGDGGLAFDVSVGGSQRGGVGEVAIGYGDLFALTAGAQRFEAEGDHAASANVGVRVGALPILSALYVLGTIVAH
ncbi:MAG TPA: hypothetical protein VFQ53_36300 [Kofleriaceae bacterium]|nr:hypothetical protein [Kofleriaceae bacterium]